MERLSLDQLPKDDGYLPAGMWMVALRDHFSDSMGGATFYAGLTVRPVTGKQVKHFVTFLPVVGVLRVEGASCSIGDVSRLLPAEAVQPAAAQAVAPVAQPAQPDLTRPATVQDGRAPTTKSELMALSETDLRALAVEMGAESGWKLGRIRRFVADELGIEGV